MSTFTLKGIRDGFSLTHGSKGRFLMLMVLLLLVMVVAKANPVDVREARRVGANFVSASTTMRATASDMQHVITYNANFGVPAFYVFNTSSGFVIVSADDCATPILGYSEEGQFDPNNIPVQMEEYLQGFVEQIRYGITYHLTSDPKTARQWQEVRSSGRIARSRSSAGPLLTDIWNQSCYYNNLCPEDSQGPCGHVYAGCVATAMSQIMHYWGYPTMGTGAHSYKPDGYPTQSVNFGATTYDWNNMPDELTSSSSSTQINAIATLMWHCGVAVDMMYGNNGSGAYSYDVSSALPTYFGYSSDLSVAWRDDYTDEAWLSMVKGCLDLGRPIHYSGQDTGGGGGHAFVCDGYDNNDQLHFNWGWSGYGNGFFAVDALNAPGYQFNNSNMAILNIVPGCNGETYQVTASCNPSTGGTVSGAGYYSCGNGCTVSATPATGYMFCSWTENGTVISTDPTYSFTVTENRNLVANFFESTSEECTLVFTLNDSYGDGWTGNALTVSYSTGCVSYEELTFDSGTTATVTRNVPTGSHVVLGWIPGSWMGECSFTLSYESGAVICEGSNLSADYSYEFDVDCSGTPPGPGGDPVYVPTYPTNRNVILEEFTGRDCGYCPDGHRIANEIMQANPGRVWAINVHAGGYAPTSYPNLNTTDGTTILGGFNVSGFPSGVVNRSTADAQSRSVWTSLTNTQLSQVAECNVGGQVSIDPVSRTAAITVEVYYTSNSAYNQNYLTVAMLQDSILGSQSDYGNYNPTQWVGDQYCHMHVLRDMITPAWGEAINPTTQGTLITRTYTYQIPETIGSPNGVGVDLSNITFLAWVSETYQGTPTRPILTACKLTNASEPFTTYNITATANPSAGGTITGAGNYVEGSTCTLQATANANYSFVNWTENGAVVSTDATYTFTVSESASFVANFEENTVPSGQSIVVEIGDGTSTTYMVPFNSLYGYSFTEQVFFADEIGTAGNITSISFNLGQSYTDEQTNEITLYMKNVTRETFSANTDYEPVTQGDIVYSGLWTIPANTTGWITIDLDTPFAYDGTSNLMVAMLESTSGYSTRYFVYTSVSNSGLSYYSDSYLPDPYNLDAYSGSRVIRSNRNNIQLAISTGGSVVNGDLTVHDGTTTNGYVPVYGFYADAYLKAEMVYPAAELSEMTGGNINNMKFYATQSSVSWGNANFQVFMKEVTDIAIQTYYGMDGATMVYEGSLNIVDGEMNVEFTTPYQYNGGNLLIGFYNTVQGSYVTSTWYGETVNNASVQGYNYSGLSSITPTQRNFLPKTTFNYTIQNELAFVVTPDPIVMGYRPNGAWMRPFTVNVLNDGMAVTMNEVVANNAFFQIEAIDFEMPGELTHGQSFNVNLTTGTTEAGEINANLILAYDDNGTTQYELTAIAYDPVSPDVWELAEMVSAFPFTDTLVVADVPLYDNYVMPLPAIADGADAVYQLVFTEDTYLNASVTSGENGKVALYPEDFKGLGGPDMANYYAGPQIGSVGMPFEVQIGEGTSTMGYFPFYTLYNYSIAENLFLASELEEAGVTTAPMTSLSWYANNAPGYNQQGITIWMANVDDEALTTSSHVVTDMTKVYTGEITPAIGWNEFVFNEGTFNWDGQSNVLIYCQRNNGSWNSTVQWQATSGMPFTCTSYRYQDSGAYDPTISNTMYTSTNRPNIIMKGGNREGSNRATVPVTFNMTDSWGDGWNGGYIDVVENGVSVAQVTLPSGSSGSEIIELNEGAHVTLAWNAGLYDNEVYFNVEMLGDTIYSVSSPSAGLLYEFDVFGGGGYGLDGTITNMTVTPGTYYLVASSTSDEFVVEIDATEVPCPEIAYNPYPADGATEVNTPRVHLRWSLGDRTTEYRIMYGTTYYCEDTLVDWTRELSNNCWLTGLFNNTNYFWRIDQRNDGCPEGTRGEVWGFTTHLNVPPYLYAGNHYLQEGSYAFLYWGTPAERGLLSYNIYQDDVFIGNTSQDYFYIYDLPYNMNGYRFNVTAVYDEGESGYSSPCYIYVSGYGYVEGHVYEQDGVTPIANAFISLSGTDEFGYSSYFVFNTDDNGYYYGALKAGSYSATAICNGYQDKTYMGTVSVIYSSTTTNIDFVMDEKFYPVTEVVAQYFPDSLDLDSPFVKVYWGMNTGASSIEDFETGDFSKYDWQNDANYPWEITVNDPYNGSYCMKSGGAGVANVVSNIMVTVDIPTDGLMSFYGKISSENNWDFGYFFIDGVQMGSYTGAGYWSEQLFAITSGEHTFQWRYTKDGSVNSNDDCFYVDYISFLKNPESASVGLRDYSDRDDNNSMVSSAGIKGASVQNGNRSFQYYRVYRTDAFNYGPYNTENTVLLADQLTDTVYIDVAWQNLETGVYKYGVSCVYEGNRESTINWGALNFGNDSGLRYNPELNEYETSGTTQKPACGSRDAWDLLYTYNCSSGYQYGVASDGVYIYNSCWSSSAGFMFAKYDMQGNFIETFDVDGCGYCRDLTYDGQYFYGVANSSTIYCIDLANHTLISTINSAYGAMRCCSYDSVRDGFWVVGNWSGDLTLVDRTGAIQITGPAPESASGVAYFMDANNVEHVYCFNNGNNQVYDYDIASNTIASDPVFDFNNTPGCTGTSGGCFVGDFNGTMAFYGVIQQSPNLVGIYELNSVPAVPGLQVDRESEISWSNPIDKNMLLGQDEVTISVLLNSADSPEGTVVSFVNQNVYEQQYHPVADITLDATGYYAWENFRRGTYQVTVQHDGYETIIDNVSIMEPTDLSYVMTEIIYNASDLYVSSTGWAMWNPNGTPAGTGDGDAFFFDLDEGLPGDWTVIDADGDGYTWVSSMEPGVYHNSSVNLEGTGHDGSAHYVISASYANGLGQALSPDNYFVSPQVNLVVGSSFSFWACAQDTGYPAEHFGVAISDNGLDNWTMVNEWTMTAKGSGMKSIGRNGVTRDQGNWYYYSVDLSAYTGQKYIAIRHFNCYDQFILNVDDVELTAGAKSGDRHLENFTVECTTLDGVLLFSTETEQTFYQIPTDELVSGEHYIVKVAANYTTGLSDWNQVEWQYISCDNYDGTVNGVTIDGNEISWEYPEIQGGDSFTESWDDGLNGWTNIDNDGDGHMWYHSTEVGNHSTLAITSHSGEGHLMDESYCNATWNALMPDDYIVSPQQYAIGVGSTISLWACTQDVNYPSEHFGFAISMGSNTNASDFTTIAEWTITSKGAGNGIIGRAGRSSREGAWYQFSADLSDYAGQNVWIAVRHFNCTDQFILNIDDIELTNGGRSGNLRYGILGTMIFADGEVVDFVEYPTNTYVYEGNAREVSVRLVYNGTSNLPEGNIYYSMSCPESIGGNTQVTQTTDFAEGWNWWSTYIDQTGIDGLTMLEEGLGDNGVTIKSQGDGFVQYMTYGGYNFWYGTLDHMANTQTYMVQTNAAVQVEMNGTAASPANSPITISEGWNWIGFPSANAMDFATAFSGITPMDGDIVKSQNSFAQYMVYGNYSFWYGELSSGVITPGMGLMYKSVNGESYTLTYPVVGRNDVVAEIPVEKHWTNNVHLYPANMTVLAVVELNDIELRSDSYELAAFANGEVRGSARLTYVEPLNRYMAFLTVSGNEAAELHFALYDAETGEENYTSSDKLVYETDAAVGSYDEPMVVSFRSTTGLDDIERDLQVYPNPVKRGERFSFNLPVGSEVRVDVVNALGAIISTETSTKAPASFVAPSTAGIYTIRITVEGKETYCRKLIVR